MKAVIYDSHKLFEIRYWKDGVIIHSQRCRAKSKDDAMYLDFDDEIKCDWSEVVEVQGRIVNDDN